MFTFIELVVNYGVWVRHSVLILFSRNGSGGDASPCLAIRCCSGWRAVGAADERDLNVHLMVALMVIAAIVGDALNWLIIGRLLGEKAFQ